MATACDISGAVYPAEFKDHRILPMEGISLRPAFAGAPLHRVKPIFWMHEGNRAVRSGPWKAVMKFKGEWELYNIDEDRTEQNNLVKKNPLVAQMLIRQWEDWAATTYVDEWIGRARNDWGEEPKMPGGGKQKAKAKNP
jgi:arylsulfatase